MTRLADAVKLLLCDVARLYATGDERLLCQCSEPRPATYRCAYGDCEILRCTRCGRIYNIVYKRRCNFPYT